MDLRIGHLYPDLMSIYGDRGNVLALTQRAKWRGIDVESRAFTAGEPWDADWADVYFFGGGQDLGQDIVGADLQGEHGDQLQRSIAGGAAVFSVCGGYQLLGREYVPEVGEPIPGLGVMDVTTRAGKVRFVGNLLAETDDGRMLIGRVIAGHGNNGSDKTEGAVQGKLIGCYLHGSALPKNPWLADQLIGWALARRFSDVTLDSLDDTEEYAAQRQAAEVAKTRT